MELPPSPADQLADTLLDDLLHELETYDTSTEQLALEERIALLTITAADAEDQARAAGDTGDQLIREITAFLQSEAAQDFFALKDEQSARVANGDICCGGTDEAITPQALEQSQQKQASSNDRAGGGSNEPLAVNGGKRPRRTTSKTAKKQQKRLGLFAWLLAGAPLPKPSW